MLNTGRPDIGLQVTGKLKVESTFGGFGKFNPFWSPYTCHYYKQLKLEILIEHGTWMERFIAINCTHEEIVVKHIWSLQYMHMLYDLKMDAIHRSMKAIKWKWTVCKGDAGIKLSECLNLIRKVQYQNSKRIEILEENWWMLWYFWSVFSDFHYQPGCFSRGSWAMLLSLQMELINIVLQFRNFHSNMKELPRTFIENLLREGKFENAGECKAKNCSFWPNRRIKHVLVTFLLQKLQRGAIYAIEGLNTVWSNCRGKLISINVWKAGSPLLQLARTKLHKIEKKTFDTKYVQFELFSYRWELVVHVPPFEPS